jgi:hypothetical protein
MGACCVSSYAPGPLRAMNTAAVAGAFALGGVALVRRSWSDCVLPGWRVAPQPESGMTWS